MSSSVVELPIGQKPALHYAVHLPKRFRQSLTHGCQRQQLMCSVYFAIPIPFFTVDLSPRFVSPDYGTFSYLLFNELINALTFFGGTLRYIAHAALRNRK